MHLLMQVFSAVTNPLDSWKMLVAADGKSLIQQTLHLAPAGYKVEYPKPDLLHRGLSFTPSFCRKSWSPNVVPASLIRFPHGLRCLYPAAGSKWIKWSTQSTSEFWAHGAQKRHCPWPQIRNRHSELTMCPSYHWIRHCQCAAAALETRSNRQQTPSSVCMDEYWCTNVGPSLILDNKPIHTCDKHYIS